MTEPTITRRQMWNMAVFLALDSVPLWMRGRWYVALAGWQMRRWWPDLRKERRRG